MEIQVCSNHYTRWLSGGHKGGYQFYSQDSIEKDLQHLLKATGQLMNNCGRTRPTGGQVFRNHLEEKNTLKPLFIKPFG